MIQRCTVPKHRNPVVQTLVQIHDELTGDYRDMIYAVTAPEVENKRTACLRNWRRKCRTLANSLKEAGDFLYACNRLTRRTVDPPESRTQPND